MKHVLQFPDIARQVMADQRLHHFTRDRYGFVAGLSGFQDLSQMPFTRES
jgi:hypothetical protein